MERLRTALEINEGEFQLFRRLLEEEVGIALEADDQPLVANRLRERILELGLSSYFEYYRRITEGPTRVSDLADLVDALTTRKTDFFRHLGQMEHFKREVIPAQVSRLRAGATHTITIWSAGCSTGEEPYSLALLLLETVPFALLQNFSILATDVSPQAVREASAGVFSPRKLEDLSPHLRNRYFEPVSQSASMRVRSQVRKLITFREHNLKSKLWSLGQFDVIFCRNVLIYFKRIFREELVTRFHSHMRPGGYLYIGHSETLQDFPNPYIFEAPTVYRRP